VTFRLLSPLEHRRLPWWDAPIKSRGSWATVAGALICVTGIALVLLAKNGLTGFDGWTALGCFLAAAAGARICASRSTT
jgi:drug/metabolite transporter (DMT)-like permease